VQVLGDLISLPKNNDLPIPWWHRAPLGLQSRTWCFVALVRSRQRPVPDLIVSVLDPSNWASLRRIRCLHVDEPGVISKAVNTVPEFNIALAESATLQSGEFHEVTLFCEPPRASSKLPSNETLKKRLEAVGFCKITVNSFDSLPVVWQDAGEIEAGWIRNVEWRPELEKRCEGIACASVDFSRAVVSADTTSRVCRFVFPFRHAYTIEIRHLDEPLVLKTITDILYRYDLNILSQLLRRGGAKPRNAVLLVVCEPKAGTNSQIPLEEVRKELEQLSPRLMIHMSHSSGRRAERTITPREPNTVLARVPAGLVEKVRRVRSFFPASSKASIFFSHRFVDHPRARTLSQALRDAVRDNNCNLLEASPDDDIRGPALVYNDVSAKMWAADAGIVLVAKVDGQDPMGKNLPQELGFMLGQGKPLLLLVDSQLEGTHPLGSNLDGVFAPRFPADEIAYLKDNPNSLHSIITKWVGQITGGSGAV
jgi:hypothetical protein